MTETTQTPATRWLPYTASPYRYRRRRTRVVMVGDVGIGGDHPIRLQSMTTTPTQDVAATVAQIVRLVQAGCEIVRLTVPTVQDARSLKEIRAELQRRGVRVPLVADIHFSPAAALEAAPYVEKVRINPGNYADSKRFVVREYSDAEYQRELERVAERFRPLVRRCRDLGIAMRIGTNHGSLSDRILNRYGDTPLGMVESALEFVRIAAAEGYHDIVLSMKASNPKVMVQAYRLLAVRLAAEGFDYPFHLGVTEAGNGPEGRIKSAVGIGTLLLDGLGDTIRVSLTEEPENEIPVARAMAAPYQGRPLADGVLVETLPCPTYNPVDFVRRLVRTLNYGRLAIGGRQPVAVALHLPGPLAETLATALTFRGPDRPGKIVAEILRVDLTDASDLAALRTLAARERRPVLVARTADPTLATAALDLAEAVEPLGDRIDLAALARTARARGRSLWLVEPGTGVPPTETDVLAVERLLARVETARTAGLNDLVVALAIATGEVLVRSYRLLAAHLDRAGLDLPLHLLYTAGPDLSLDLLGAASALGALLGDGLGDSVEIAGPAPLAGRLRLAYDVLQGAGARLHQAEFVACPSCGRTLFDLQTTTERIKARTRHLTGVKIAIMGCVVNGPGEMADADFGYVGGAPGRVNLYVGKECVEKNIPIEEADDRLIALIKAHGKWVDPPAESAPETALR